MSTLFTGLSDNKCYDAFHNLPLPYTYKSKRKNNMGSETVAQCIIANVFYKTNVHPDQVMNKTFCDLVCENIALGVTGI